MTQLRRTVRTGGRMSLRADSILSTALLAELVHPGGSVWLVSGWITDVEVLDNTQGAYESLLGENPPGVCRLSELIIRMVRSGNEVHIVTRPDSHNRIFTERVRTALPNSSKLHIIFNPKVHEKTICGRDWMITGSMNFTVSGFGENEESVTYQIDDPEVAQAHLDFTEKWKRQA
ncbi:phospholipase D-like domain-containing protein DpdK [Streptosporangium roseum]|uniref:phospholipase D-like domain-containing protein DpdK n=1 Tax=Streptosporangium roseum TaxID=2001 RepID=UPI00331F3DC3